MPRWKQDGKVFASFRLRHIAGDGDGVPVVGSLRPARQPPAHLSSGLRYCRIVPNHPTASVHMVCHTRTRRRKTPTG